LSNVVFDDKPVPPPVQIPWSASYDLIRFSHYSYVVLSGILKVWPGSSTFQKESFESLPNSKGSIHFLCFEDRCG
jgi:hypothetical protein